MRPNVHSVDIKMLFQASQRSLHQEIVQLTGTEDYACTFLLNRNLMKNTMNFTSCSSQMVLLPFVFSELYIWILEVTEQRKNTATCLHRASWPGRSSPSKPSSLSSGPCYMCLRYLPWLDSVLILLMSGELCCPTLQQTDQANFYYLDGYQ